MLLGLLILVWTSCKKRRLTIAGMLISCKLFFFQTPGEVSPNFSIEREPSKRIHVVRDEIDKDSIDFQTRYSMSRSLDKIGKAAQNREKQEKPKLDNARKRRECTSSIRMTQSIQISSKKKKTARQNWKD